MNEIVREPQSLQSSRGVFERLEVSYGPTGLSFGRVLSEDELAQLGDVLMEGSEVADSFFNLSLGDWANQTHRYGEKKKRLLERWGKGRMQHILNLCSVAARIPEEIRDPRIKNYEVYRNIARLENVGDRARWVRKAAEGQLSGARVKELIALEAHPLVDVEVGVRERVKKPRYQAPEESRHKKPTPPTSTHWEPDPFRDPDDIMEIEHVPRPSVRVMVKAEAFDRLMYVVNMYNRANAIVSNGIEVSPDLSPEEMVEKLIDEAYRKVEGT